MPWDVTGLGNALVDALVVMENDEALLDELGFARGKMHPVDHDVWMRIYERVSDHQVTFDSGGSCANAVATVGLLGGRALYCGQVGDDQMGRMYASRMTDTCGAHALVFDGTHATGKCLSIISKNDAERTLITDFGAATRLSTIGHFTEALTQTRIAHFTGYTFTDGPMQQLAMSAIDRAHRAGAMISIDAADPFVVLAHRDVLWSMLDTYGDIAFLNAEEAEALTGLVGEAAAMHIASHARIETVVVKLGAMGSVVVHQGDVHHIEAERVEAIDTTGAGDAYAGGFLYGMIAGVGAEVAGRLGSAAAALTVGQIGAVVKDKEMLQAVKARVLGA